MSTVLGTWYMNKQNKRSCLTGCFMEGMEEQAAWAVYKLCSMLQSDKCSGGKKGKLE